MVSLLWSFLFIYFLITSRKKPIETPNCGGYGAAALAKCRPQKVMCFFSFVSVLGEQNAVTPVQPGVRVDNVVSVSCSYRMYV